MDRISMTEAIQQSVRVEPEESVCSAVITAVAAAKDVDPLDLDQRLNDVVDPDALDRIFGETATGRRRSAGHVAFVMEGCEVVVTASGRVTATVSEGGHSTSAGVRSSRGDPPRGRADLDG